MSALKLNDIIDELGSFVKENILDSSVSINNELSFKDLGVDSFSIIQVVLFIERKYDVVMSDKDLTPDNLESIKSLAKFTLKNK